MNTTVNTPRNNPLVFIPNETNRTINFSINNNDRWQRDLERMQWFTTNNGYTQTTTEWIGTYEQEEFNCVQRYLLRFGWIKNN